MKLPWVRVGRNISPGLEPTMDVIRIGAGGGT
jgi:hypothetical protein